MPGYIGSDISLQTTVYTARHGLAARPLPRRTDEPSSSHGPTVGRTQGRTPLYWAAFKGHEACVSALLADAKVNVNQADTSVSSPDSVSRHTPSTRCLNTILFNFSISKCE